MGKRKRDRGRKRRARRGAARHSPHQPVIDLDRQIEHAMAEIGLRAAEAHSPDTPAERVAAIVVEDFADLPAPVGFVETLREQESTERVRAVAAEVQRLAAGSLTALTFAAEVARAVDGDPERSVTLLEEALEVLAEPNAFGPMGQHLMGAGMVREALDLVDQCLLEDPGDETAQEVRAAALGQLHNRASTAKRLGRVEQEALAQFADRGVLYRLRDSMREFVEDRPELRELVALTLREWLEELEESGLVSVDELLRSGDDVLNERYDGVVRLAIERAWLRERDDDFEDEGVVFAEAEPGLDRSTAPLARLATDPATPLEIADAAAAWLETCTYGLWQVADPVPTPGVWLTDIVSGVHRYAAVPPEQLEGLGPWGVLLGSLVAIDGTWRSTGTVLHMRPTEADVGAEFAREATDDLVRALSGKRVRRTRDRGGLRQPEPHGVLAGAAEPADAMLAELISKVLGNLLPAIAADLWHRRAAGPTLTNAEGQRLKLISAEVKVTNQSAAAKRLAAHPDFTPEEDGELTWWGRELTEMERQSALAELRARLGDEEPVENPDEPPRWLRGRLRPGAGGFEVEVNSEERLSALVATLDELGFDPEPATRSVIDPVQDMPPLSLEGRQSFGASQEATDAWLTHWPGERVPALGQLTPRVAAQRKDRRARLEALLREFEHDAHLLAAAGAPAPDIGRLRAELGMERWWE